jgi:hypothetical protein
MMLALHSRPMETSSPLEVLSLLWQLEQRSEVRKSSAGFCGVATCAREAGGNARRARATTRLAATRAFFIASSNVVHDNSARDEPSARTGRRRVMGQATRDARFSVSSIATWRGQAESLIQASAISKYCVAVGLLPIRTLICSDRSRCAGRLFRPRTRSAAAEAGISDD